MSLRFLHRAWRYRLGQNRAEIAFLRKHLPRGGTAIDIGAHKGGYTYWMAKTVGPAGLVVCFEPQPALAAALRENVTGFKQVRVEQAAVSAAPGKLQLRVPGGSGSPGASLESRVVPQADESFEVAVESLDHYAGKLRRPVHLIKIDVEGHELGVFEGAAALLRADKPMLMFECEARHHAAGDIRPVFALLESLGYRGRFHLRGKLHPLADFNAAKHQIFGTEPYVNNFIFTSQK